MIAQYCPFKARKSGHIRNDRPLFTFIDKSVHPDDSRLREARQSLQKRYLKNHRDSSDVKLSFPSHPPFAFMILYLRKWRLRDIYGLSLALNVAI